MELAELVRPEAASNLLKLITPTSYAPKENSTFGHYRLLSRLGKGGFGDVWLAEQQEPLRREVALKFIHPGIISREVISRFERERQAMAMMEHQNIAKVYDANCIDGSLYFAMEYVPGQAITSYVKAKNLSLRQRIELFIPVCRAVHHAHLKHVLHRDLKPANILVTESDGVAVPKVIDFGIAKPLSRENFGEDADTNEFTMTLPGYCVGTPQYMSPEQALGLSDIDAASDTYALGITLYEMLVGEPPITKHEMEGLALHQQLDRVIQHETELPSTLWLSAATASNTRRYDKTLGDNPKLISRQLRGDIDWILRKALDKNRTQRYLSAADLANDLAAFLSNKPISAGRPSLSYRLRRTCRRHSMAMLAASFTLCVGLSGGIAFHQWQRAEAARTEENQLRAASYQAKAEAMDLVDFMLHDLGPKLETVNQASLLHGVNEKAAAFLQAHSRDNIGTSSRNSTLERKSENSVALSQRERAVAAW